MTAGTVKWFNSTKVSDLSLLRTAARTSLIHHSAIQGSGYKDLSKGQRVEFDTEQGAKGPQATRDLACLDSADQIDPSVMGRLALATIEAPVGGLSPAATSTATPCCSASKAALSPPSPALST